jgi:hypothetical protein
VDERRAATIAICPAGAGSSSFPIAPCVSVVRRVCGSASFERMFETLRTLVSRLTDTCASRLLPECGDRLCGKGRPRHVFASSRLPDIDAYLNAHGEVARRLVFAEWSASGSGYGIGSDRGTRGLCARSAFLRCLIGVRGDGGGQCVDEGSGGLVDCCAVHGVVVHVPHGKRRGCRGPYGAGIDPKKER